MELNFFIAALLIILLVIICLISYARWNYGKLDGLGFPIIKPSFMLGSSPDLYKHIQHYEDIKRSQIYGPIWGYYQGRVPIVFIADPDLIRQIFVKDYSYFYNRDPFDLGHEILNQILDFLPNEKWKTMRVTQTKLFSSVKIKQYVNEVFKDSIDRFCKRLDDEMKENNRNSIKLDTRGQFCAYSIDAIARSMFSLEVDPLKDTGFFSACKKLIGEGQEIDQFYVWRSFPFLSKFAPTLILDLTLPKNIQSVVKSRLESGVVVGDYTDVMVECMKKLNTQTFKKLGITETTLLGQGVNLFIAGFDRISSLMSFLSYHLALNPDIQQKLNEEIHRVLNGTELNYESLQKMTYLQACIFEVSRMYPILIRPERVCNKDWTCPERGIKIPEGVLVMIASWAVNRNPELYKDPNSFVPERFLPENKGELNPYGFTTFGFGHRNCIGMRFAYEALKMSMARIVMDYEFKIRDDTELKFKPGINFILQFEPLLLNIEKRVSKM